MTYFYGDPLQRIETLFLDFETYLIKFARSGRLFAEVGAFEYGIEGKEMKRVCVTLDVWRKTDEGFFGRGGFAFDG